MNKACSNCAKVPKDTDTRYKVCSRCKMYSYCSQQCQKEHWKEHKNTCGIYVMPLLMRVMKEISRLDDVSTMRLRVRVCTIYRSGMIPIILYNADEAIESISHPDRILHAITPRLPSHTPSTDVKVSVQDDRPLFVSVDGKASYMCFTTPMDDVIARHALTRSQEMDVSLSSVDVTAILNGTPHRSSILPSGITIDRDRARIETGLILIMMQWHTLHRQSNMTDEKYLLLCIDRVKRSHKSNSLDVDLSIRTGTLTQCKASTVEHVISSL